MSSELIDWLAEVAPDPLAFVLGAFPWGQPGSRLEKFTGPEAWQIDVLTRIRDGLPLHKAIQEATASGHGVGKSALVAWCILWAMTTETDTRGVVTANTENQLKTKTWAELGKWFHLFIGRDFFKLTATALFSVDPEHERTWRIDMVPWSERNTEAFAGLHNQGRRIIVVFDEASAIPDVIWETTEGALTDADTEIIWLVFGNPTRNIGRFKECFGGGQFANFWHSRQVDSRQVSFTNKDQIEKWVTSYGEDSDFCRIRIYGMFPRVGEMEFFNAADIEAAMAREGISYGPETLAMGVDVARYGKNNSVIWARKGRDAKSIPRQRFQGISTVQLADKVQETYHSLQPDGIFIDGGGVGGGVVDQTRAKNLFCYEVQFGAKDDTPHLVFGSQGEKYANKRSGMYGAMRAWLKNAAIPNEPDIKKQFASIKYLINKRDEIQLISKEDMLKLDPDLELDDIDALATTFAHALSPNNSRNQHTGLIDAAQSDYNPFDNKHIYGTENGDYDIYRTLDQ